VSDLQEHHLQKVISEKQTYGREGDPIPTPDFVQTPESYYNDLYPANYKSPRQLIFVQPFAIDKNLPDYDMDSEDEQWLADVLQKDGLKIDVLQFEEIIECLEKQSVQDVVTMDEAKKLIKGHDVVISAVFDYWLSKRIKNPQPLIHLVRTEKRDGSANNNPYVAFRRRTEKMQTRKNRKNDEASYEKMLKLKRDLSKAV
jgi:enhancer of polycomb-like protein